MKTPDASRRRRLRSTFGNACLGALFALFAWAHLESFLETFRLSVLLIVAKETLDAAFYLTRRSPERFSRSTYEWATGLGGTFCPLLFRPTDAPSDLVVGQVLLCAGLVLQSLAMLSLRRSIGIVPAHRGIVTTGLYRFVRHPMYSAYALTFAGYLLSHASPLNFEVFALWLLLAHLRMLNEERFLAADPTYADFLSRTRWRLVPGVL